MPGEFELWESMNHLGYGLLICGKFGEAWVVAEENLRQCQELGHRPLLARTLGLTAAVLQDLGQYDRASEQALLDIRVAEEIGELGLASYAMWLLGDIRVAQGQYAEAGEILKRSIEIHRSIRYQARLKDVVTSEGYAAYGLGQSHEVRRCLVEALQMSLDDRLWFTAIRALPLAALYAISQERAETAVELYALASSVQHIANSSWFEDVAGRHVTAAAQALPAAVVCAAQERGRTRDLWQTIEEVLESVLQDA
jgi:tetratricopeptide (TPR) repeat protein